MKKYLVVVMLIALGFLVALTQQIRSGYKNVIPAEVEKLMAEDSNVVLLDVRTKAEFESETGHLKGATLIPVQELEERVGELDRYKDKTIIAYCRSGQRSSFAASILQSRGFKVVNMTGGMLRWNAERRPVQREESKRNE